MCALLLAPELRAKLLLSQAEKDGIFLVAYAQLPRRHLRYALRRSDLLQHFDSLLYDELLSELTSGELRYLNSPSCLWLRLPEDIDYFKILEILPKRKRRLPRVLRGLAQEITFDAESSEPTSEEN